jgi:hypothetical protein
MKKSIVYLLIVLLKIMPCYSQEIINNTGTVSNEAIQQISLPGIDDLLSFQNLNRAVSNYVLTQQTGNLNSATINQKSDGSSEMSNQSYTVQSGNSNELTIGQIGSGNVLLAFQLDYISNLIDQKQQSQVKALKSTVSTVGIPTDGNGYIVEGERNKMIITQEGTNNGIMAVQQGSDNTISAEQAGENNYLLALQKGSKNTVIDYKQENKSDDILFDRIIQVGDNLTLKSDEVSKSSINGNTFIQTGTNLSLEINSELLNTAGGIEINQKGTDMKVKIDQSYFSFPLK